jgi:hypothetical protein
MVFPENKNHVNLATWVKYFLILDIVVYIVLLLIFPDLWFIGYQFVVLIIGTVVLYLMYEKLLQYKDTWKKPAEILVTVTVGINAIFCIIIIAAIIIGVLNAARV